MPHIGSVVLVKLRRINLASQSLAVSFPRDNLGWYESHFSTPSWHLKASLQNLQRTYSRPPFKTAFLIWKRHHTMLAGRCTTVRFVPDKAGFSHELCRTWLAQTGLILASRSKKRSSYKWDLLSYSKRILPFLLIDFTERLLLEISCWT